MTSGNISKSPATKTRTRVHVVLTEGGWQVRHDEVGRTSGVYRTRAEAAEAAQSVLRRSGGDLTVRGRDGSVRESMTLGRDPMARISAVEGIHLSSDSKRMLEEFDSAGASGEERRRSIARQFGKRA